jgi:hypothetical protein
VILSRDADRILVGLEECFGVLMLSHGSRCLIKSPVLPLLDTGLSEHVDNSCKFL